MGNTNKVSRRDTLAGALSVPLAVTFSAKEVAAQKALTNTPILVAYFSRSGNTRVIAGQIHRAYGADLFEIVPSRPYPEDYQATVSQAQMELDAGYEPPLAATVPNIASYIIVFL